MKNLFLLLLAVALLSSTTISRTAGVAKIQDAKTQVAAVPNGVLNTFNQIVGDLMNTNFPYSPEWDAAEVSWDRERNVWTCTGMVRPTNGVYGSGVNFISLRIRNNGVVLENSYEVVIPT